MWMTMSNSYKNPQQIHVASLITHILYKFQLALYEYYNSKDIYKSPFKCRPHTEGRDRHIIIYDLSSKN